MLTFALRTIFTMAGMRKKAGAGAIALAAMMAAASGAAAAPRCATSDEVTAIQAEVVHELLMNAGLYCGNAGRDKYNAYQSRYIPERIRTSAALMRMFRRLNGRAGEGEYHAFTTRVANNYSIRAIHDNGEFCHTADIVFDAAMMTDKPSLASFVSGIEVTEQGPVDSCQLRVAVGLKNVVPPVVPKPNPMREAALAPGAASPAATAPANN
jgi:hypothetical protein